MAEELLRVKDLKTYFYTSSGVVKAVNGISFRLNKGEIMGIVGESGSGKSVAVSSLLRLILPPGKIVSGEVWFAGEDIFKYSPKEMLKIRGNKIAMIFQDPMTALNPVFTVGQQIIENIMTHQKVNKHVARQRAVEALEFVGIPDAAARVNSYPHEFSGGMRQRVMIAMALVCNPALLIADEPTTALDVTIQAQVLDLIKNLQQKLGTAIIIITHNLGVVWETCQKVMVMYAGNAVEYTDTVNLYNNPRHPYTWGLLDSMPKLSIAKDAPLNSIQGNPPDPRLIGSGCSFAERCPYATDVCGNAKPELEEIQRGHFVACHLQHHGRQLARRRSDHE
jgi:oligopeptide/dipeptide ABC transporter ATP-binding protein